MAKRQVHWVWPAFVALSQMRTATAEEIFEQMYDLWPALPIRELVRAEGDERLALQLIQAANQGSDNDQAAAPDSGQGATTSDPQDMNSLIRHKAGRPSQPGPKTASGPRDDFVRARYTERYRQAGQG